MGHRIVYSSAYGCGLRETLTAPLTWLPGTALALLLRAAGSEGRTHLRGMPPNQGRPLIFFTWHEQGWVASAALYRLPASERPAFFAHDGLFSRLTYTSAYWLDFDVLAFRRRATPGPREQLAELIRQRGGNAVVFPDSGGPYRQLKPGFLEVARAAGALVVPIAASCRPVLRLGRALRHQVPLPGATLTLQFGAPLPAETTVEAAQAALVELCAPLGEA